MSEIAVYIVDCIPISRGIGKESLSYFTILNLKPGNVVSVPLRGKKINAIVVSTRAAKDSKSEIRSQSFKTRKVDKLLKKNFLSTELLNAAVKVARYSISTTGAVLNLITPKIILDNVKDLKIPRREVKSFVREKFVLQGSREDRFAHYKSIVREAFARGHSVFICVPTLEEGRQIKERLQKGIESFTFLLHSDLKKAEILKNWNKVLKEEHPVLIIGTTSHISLPRVDIGTYIIEHESSDGYISMIRPYLDTRVLVEQLTKEMGNQIVLADCLLRVETIHRQRKGDYVEVAPLTFRSLSSAEYEVIDMREDSSINKELSISQNLKKHIEEALSQKENVFIYTSRKGFFPITLCGDCGSIIRCKECHASVVLHSNKKETEFKCHHCGLEQDAKILCPNCKSWKLIPLGVGIENVERELKELFPKIPIFRLDADAASTDKKASVIRDNFYNTQGAILLGTQKALPYLHEPVYLSAVASIDSLFMIPDYKIRERIMHNLIEIRSLATERFVIQSRDPDYDLFSFVTLGNLIAFHREEVKDRKDFDYPPFSTLIKVSKTGNGAAKDIEKIVDLVSPYTVDLYENPYTSKGRATFSALLRVPEGEWVDKKLSSKLSSLPPTFTIEVNPQSVL